MFANAQKAAGAQPTLEHPFSWLSADGRGTEYVSFTEFSDLPACSFDFGDKGYAASSNYGGELLQMTARSDKHGIVFARGDFEYSMYLSLARGQRQQGGKSVFGLQIAAPEEPPESTEEKVSQSYSVGRMIERGCYNYRWPYNQFCLHVKKHEPDSASGDLVPEKVGTCSLLSFVRKGVLHQLLRVDLPRRSTNESQNPELVLAIESPMRLQFYANLNGEKNGTSSIQGQKDNKSNGYRITKIVRCDKFGQEYDASKDDASKDGDYVARFMSNVRDGEAVKSKIHWQAKLAELFVDKDGKSAQWKDLYLKKMNNDKMDHIFKDDDDLKSVPRYKANLSTNPAGTTAHGQSRIFLASFCLFEEFINGQAEESDSKTTVQVPDAFEQTPSPDEIQAFIGIGKSSDLGARMVAMWEYVFNKRQREMDSISELPEACIVGRCLEKILGVDVVQAQQLVPHSALVSNMFLKANVDMKALFWKTRFLIKVDLLLSKIIGEKKHGDLPGSGTLGETLTDESNTNDNHCPTPEPYQDFVELSTASKTVTRIRNAIDGIIAFITHIVLPSRCASFLPKTPDLGDPDYHYTSINRCYLMITLWYAIKHYPERQSVWKWKDTVSGTTHLDSHQSGERAQHFSWSHHGAAKVKYSMIKWLHDESLLSMQHKVLEEENVRDGQGSAETTALRLQLKAQHEKHKKKTQQSRRAAETELVRRISSTDTYRADDEISDRLGFLAEELWAGTPSTEAEKLAKLFAKRITKRILDRKLTPTIKPCHPTSVEDGSADGPWEIHALCHHSRLMVACRTIPQHFNVRKRADSEQEVEHFRKMLYPFLTSETSITPCWERSNLSARRGFLRSEATAIVASTIVDIFRKDLDYFFPRPKGVENSGSTVSSTQPPETRTVGENRHEKTPATRLQEHANGTGKGSTGDSKTGAMAGANGGGTADERREESPSPCQNTRNFVRHHGESVDTERLLVQQLELQEQLAVSKGLGGRIDYMRFRPPQTYHPKEFFNSLDDTPELYSEVAMEAKIVPQAILYEMNKPPKLPPDMHSSQLHNKRGEENTLDPRTVNLLDGILRCGGEPPENMLKALSVIDLETPDSLSARQPEVKSGDDIRVKISDSLIDQEIRHRLLFARIPYKLPKGLLKLLVYVLHPEMTECFKYHVLRVSRFGRPKANDMVLAHITLRSWSLRPEGSSTDGRDQEDVIEVPEYLRKLLDANHDRDEGEDTRGQDAKPAKFRVTGEPKEANLATVQHVEHPLGSVSNEGLTHSEKQLRNSSRPPVFELMVSSVGISTNEFGDFSKCSIISDLIEEPELENLGPQLQTIWDSFIHQPQTGRFLVFAVILGLLCQGIVRKYSDLYVKFLDITNLDSTFMTYLEDSEKSRKHDGDGKLRLSLWSLEALYKMSNTMTTSVETIQLAIDDINREIQEEPNKRSKELEDICQTHLEKLKRDFSDLSALHTKLERHVELNTRYSNALSSILALRDSRDSYRQNNTIEKLTYLTIGCLPIGLTAALFAIPSEQRVMAADMGAGWFAASILVFLTVIFAVAYFLEGILQVLQIAVEVLENARKETVARWGKRKAYRKSYSDKHLTQWVRLSSWLSPAAKRVSDLVEYWKMRRVRRVGRDTPRSMQAVV